MTPASRLPSGDTRDIARGALANLAGLLLRGFSVLFMLTLGRLYGAELTGLYLLTFALVDALSNLGTLGLDRSVLALAARCHDQGDLAGVRRLVANALVIGLVSSLGVAIVLEAASAPIAVHLFAKPEVTVPIRIMALALPLWTVGAVLVSTTRALRVMRFQIITKNVIEPAVKCGVAVLAWALGLGLGGLAMAVPLSALAGVAAALWFCHRMVSFGGEMGRPEAGERRQLFRLAVPIGLYDLLNQLMRRTDVFLVGRFLPSAAVGIYGAAHESATAVKAVRQAFDPIAIPVLASAQHRRDHAGMLEQYRNVTRWILLLDLAMVGSISVAARSIMGIFGPEFAVGATVLLLVAAAIAVNGVLGVAEVFLLIDRPSQNLLNTLGTMGLQAALILMLVPRYGLLGAALALFGAMAAMNTARVIQVARRYGLQPFTRYHLRAAAAASFALAVVTLGRELLRPAPGLLPDALAVAAFLLLFGGGLSALGLAPPERQLLNAIGRRGLRVAAADEEQPGRAQ